MDGTGARIEMPAEEVQFEDQSIGQGEVDDTYVDDDRSDAHEEKQAAFA